MRTFGKALGVALMGVAALMMAACEPDALETVGLACGATDDCEAFEGAYCAELGICSAACSVHSDCGCVAGTTSDDIQAGACWARCVVDSAGSGFCARACGEDADCDGLSVCEFGPSEAIGSCL